MVQSGFFNDGFGIGIFRAVPNFVLQFGLHGDPDTETEWRARRLRDDKVVQSNQKGFLTFATSGANTRTTQLFFNMGNNKFLDSRGFAPIAACVEGCEVLEKIEMKYRETPNQGTIASRGNAYLKADFPDLDYITGAFLE